MVSEDREIKVLPLKSVVRQKGKQDQFFFPIPKAYIDNGLLIKGKAYKMEIILKPELEE